MVNKNQNKNAMTDYQTAKGVAETLETLQNVTVEVSNNRLFRKYLNDFAKIEKKEFRTKSDGNSVNVIRVK